jgi:hypothetical protein
MRSDDLSPAHIQDIAPPGAGNHAGAAPTRLFRRGGTRRDRPSQSAVPRRWQLHHPLSNMLHPLRFLLSNHFQRFFMHIATPTAPTRPAFSLRAVLRKFSAAVPALLLIPLGLCLAFPGYALDLVGFTGITGPLTSALTQIASLGPGIKALVGFVGFVVALISLSALRNFGPVLFYVGLAIFAAVGLVIAGAIMGAVI